MKTGVLKLGDFWAFPHKNIYFFYNIQTMEVKKIYVEVPHLRESLKGVKEGALSEYRTSVK
jgi:hypothetical protein